MAEKIGSVWALDIGNTSLKALRLSNETGTLQVIGFDHIQHGKILSGTGIKEQEKQELIAITLRQFVEQNDISKDDIIISVPSANSFARFVNLPPVEPKRIPEIVRFEASQQIPFDINAVQWDWQMMSEEGAAEAKVGIFAIKNDVVTAELEYFSRENLQVGYVQIAPMALYNYIAFDRPDLTSSDVQATAALNIGAENTDLVVCTKSDVWNRTIPMGGNTFTKSIADTFKLSFEKAEKLKRTAPMSKYARQILQAMKPVFADLAAEIQRSIGFYSSAHPNVKLARIVALGGGTRMRGLLQYLQQSLQIPIERLDSFKQVGISSAVSAAKFHESVCDFGIVYGLGVQVLGPGRIESNLLPRNVARSMIWANKTKYFVAAALIALCVSTLTLARVFIDRAGYNKKSAVRQKIKSIIDTAKETESALEMERTKISDSEKLIQQQFDLFKKRDILPLLNENIIKQLPNEKTNPEQSELYEAYAAGDVSKIKEINRSERKQIFLTSVTIRYSYDLATATFGASDFAQKMEGRSGARDTRGDAEMLARRMAGDNFMQASRPAPSQTQRPAVRTPGQLVEGADRGFIVTIVGYSPYKDIIELLDSQNKQEDPNKLGGVISRLMNIDGIIDANATLELYKKGDVPQHYELKTGAVDLDAEMPPGIGMSKTLGNTRFLIDPLTKEVISKQKPAESTSDTTNQSYDNWFILKMKLQWKDKAAEAGQNLEATPAENARPPERVESNPGNAAKSRSKDDNRKMPDLEF